MRMPGVGMGMLGVGIQEECGYTGGWVSREMVGMSGGVGIHEGGWISWGMGIQGRREHRYAGGGYLRERVTMPQVGWYAKGAVGMPGVGIQDRGWACQGVGAGIQEGICLEWVSKKEGGYPRGKVGIQGGGWASKREVDMPGGE